jgi:hypothetical protein
MDSSAHRGSEHLLILPERQAAETIAEELREEGFADVRVVRGAARDTEEDAARGWTVYVHDDRLPETEGDAAYEGLRERFTALAHEHGGRYDEPGDPRPAG